MNNATDHNNPPNRAAEPQREPALVRADNLRENDWILISFAGDRHSRWHQLLHTRRLRGGKRVELHIRHGDGHAECWWLTPVDYQVQRSPHRLPDPAPLAPQVRRELSTRFPSTKFKVITVHGGVSVGWTDGPAEEVIRDVLAGVAGDLRTRRLLTWHMWTMGLIRHRLDNPTQRAVPTERQLDRFLDRSQDVYTDADATMAKILLGATTDPSRASLTTHLNKIGLDVLAAVAGADLTTLKQGQDRTDVGEKLR